MGTQIQLSALQSGIFWNAALFLAIVTAFVVQWSEIKRLGLHPLNSFVTIAAFYVALLIGSRLGAIGISEWKDIFLNGVHPHTDKTILGGLLFALPVYWFLKTRWKLQGTHADAIFIALPLAAAMGRLGCIAAGCCFGSVSSGNFAWTYGPGMPAYEWQVAQGLIQAGAEKTLPVYPVQLVFSAVNFFLFGTLWIIRKRLKSAGSLALLAIGLIFLNRFGIEFLRVAASNRGMLGDVMIGLKLVQWVCLIGAILMLGLFWRNERHAKKDKAVSENVPLLEIAVFLLVITASVFLSRDFVRLNERLMLLLFCTPAMGLLVQEIRQKWSFFPQRLATASMFSISSILFLFTSLDTIPTTVYPEHSFKFGAGGATGSFADVDRNCDGDVINQETIQLGSANFNAAYQNKLGEAENIELGFRGNFGRLSSSKPETAFNYNFGAFNPYFSLNYRSLGFRIGPVFVNKKPSSTVTAPFFTQKEPIFLYYFRIGNPRKFYTDLGSYEFAGMLAYPEPKFTWGFFNWGFNDPSGAKNVRLGMSIIQDQVGLSISGRGPLGNSSLNLNGGLFIQNGVSLMLGVDYRMKLREK
jgi:prolipoprotein diacylglyceryltransferase